MSKDDFELVRGSGNVYRDFGRPDAGLEQARAITAAKIIRVLDERKLSTRDAEKLTGISHSEFSHATPVLRARDDGCRAPKTGPVPGGPDGVGRGPQAVIGAPFGRIKNRLNCLNRDARRDVP
jgi:hypothetical protein